MNIQDTIIKLGLDNDSLPRILKQRVATIDGLQKQLVDAEAEHTANPTEESEEQLGSVKTYLNDYFNDVKEQLENHKAKIDKQAKAKGDADAQAKLDADAKAKAIADGLEVKDEKKSSGFGTLLIGGILLVASFGVVNILRNKQ